MDFGFMVVNFIALWSPITSTKPERIGWSFSIF